MCEYVPSIGMNNEELLSWNSGGSLFLTQLGIKMPGIGENSKRLVYK